MFHIYSYGKESPMKLLLTDRQADIVNRFTRSFFLAQENFLKENGRHWTPEEPIAFPIQDAHHPDKGLMRKGDNDRYNRVAKWLTFQYKIHNFIGTPNHEEDLYDDFLVKN